MIDQITIKDFFSFKGENTITLNKGINLLLGINGSGKTSFINAFRILYEGIIGEGLTKLLQEKWGGFDQIVCSAGEDKPQSIQISYAFNHHFLNTVNPVAGFQTDVIYRITIRPMGTGYSLDEKIYSANKKKEKGKFFYLDFHNGIGKISMKTDAGISFQEYNDGNVSGQELVLRQINDPNHYLPIFTLRKAIEAMAVYDDFNVREGSKIRRPTEFSVGKRLWSDGTNLSQILNEIKLNHSFDFEYLETLLHNVNPFYKGIDISNMYNQSYLSLRESNLKRAVGALHISDGTLRFLLLETIFVNPGRGAFLSIDEPERGLHPDMIRSVSEMMKRIQPNTQMIIATHSPQLLNQFELEDILVFEKDQSNGTTVRKVSEDDFPEWDGDFLPGQMWLQGIIGGKRW